MIPFKRAFAALCACTLFMAWACSSPTLPERMNSLAEYCVGVDSFTDEELDAVKDEYNMLLEEFKANINDYSSEERQQVFADISRINGVLTREAASRATGILGDGLRSLPDILGGFASGLGLDGIIEDLNMDSLLNGLMGTDQDGLFANDGDVTAGDDDIDYDNYDY